MLGRRGLSFLRLCRPKNCLLAALVSICRAQLHLFANELGRRCKPEKVMEGEIMGSESALEAVRQAEQKYRSIFEHCVIGIFQTTAIEITQLWSCLYVGFTK